MEMKNDECQMTKDERRRIKGQGQSKNPNREERENPNPKGHNQQSHSATLWGL